MNLLSRLLVLKRVQQNQTGCLLVHRVVRCLSVWRGHAAVKLLLSGKIEVALLRRQSIQLLLVMEMRPWLWCCLALYFGGRAYKVMLSELLRLPRLSIERRLLGAPPPSLLLLVRRGHIRGGISTINH